MPPEAELAPILAAGLTALGLAAPPAGVSALLRYVDLLVRWNAAYNLTAVREPQAMLVRHVLDSLSLAPWVSGPRLLDVGSGAGLPGIPLALLYPEMQVTLLDSNGKKTRFLRQAVIELPLAQVNVVQMRAEQYRPPQPFTTVTARAVGELAQLWAWMQPLCVPGGRILLMKGAHPGAELARLPAGVQAQVMPLTVPGLSEARHLVWLTS